MEHIVFFNETYVTIHYQLQQTSLIKQNHFPIGSDSLLLILWSHCRCSGFKRA